MLPDERVLWSDHPAWRAQILFMVKWGLLALVPAILAALFPMPGSESRWFGLSLILLLVVVLFAAIERARTFYWVSTKRIVVRRGILSRHIQSTGFERVQNVNLHQSLLDRILGIGSVDFDTAGSGEAHDDFRFTGIMRPTELIDVVAHHQQQRDRSRAGADGL